jgi:hypothetical protein
MRRGRLGRAGCGACTCRGGPCARRRAEAGACRRCEARSRPGRRSGPRSRRSAVYPTAVSPKYASESAGKQRMHTCLDQYNANKASGGNAGMKWIQKGGGYYSECNKHLKGA